MLDPGTRLGPYEVLSPLGAGGMGEVYLARDTRLGREVAIKVLPLHLSENAEVRARFEREAKTVSSLNHPNICTLFDVGREGETDYLVMERVEGETLAERLRKGPLATAELVRFGAQISDALDRAHRAGVVHRDLKPGNVMITRGGAKLMDFGLARATGVAGPVGSSSVTMSALSQSPTVAHALTAEGAIVGTFQYMSPEQLEGKEADARSDIWALGCVLYEMATGRRAFEGRSQASLIAAILEREPAGLSEAPSGSGSGAGTPSGRPQGLDRLIRACLTKDPEERIQTAHDVKLQLRWVAEGGSQAGVPIPVAARRRRRERLAWGLAGACALLVIGGGATLLARRADVPVVTRFTVTPDNSLRSMTWPRISPDGRLLAFQATDSLGRRMIWVRPLNAFTANPLPGTEEAGRPFWSPDSHHLAYFIGTQLKKIAVAGGPPQLICETKSAADGSWGAGEVILFDGAAGDSVRQVSANGGMPSAATFLDRKQHENEHAWPCFLPDGKHFLFLAFGGRGVSDATLRVGTLGSPKSVSLGPVGTRVDFAPPDLVLYALDSTLMARHLDLRRWRWVGDPFPVAERVLVRGSGQANFSASQNGVLVVMGGGSSERSELIWTDRTGRRLGREGPPAGYRDLALSPDGARLAYGAMDLKAGTQDLWVRDLKRGVASRLTFGESSEIWPVWSPDGTRIAYASDATGTYSLMTKLADGTGLEDTLFAPRYNAGPTDWSRDGRTILMAAYPGGNPDIWALSTEPGRHAREVLGTNFAETNGCLSPDGRWLAYTSVESGRPEVYVRAYPGPGGKWQVSVGGGNAPQWRGDGRELFYRGENGASLVAVPVTAAGAFEAGTPQRLFDATLARSDISRNRYVATADGQRFLLNLPTESRSVDVFNVALNWTAELARK